MAILYLMSISIINVVFAQTEESYIPSQNDDELFHMDLNVPSSFQQRTAPEKNFLRYGQGNLRPLPNDYEDYEELLDETKMPMRTSRGNFLRFGRSGSNFLRLGRAGSNSFMRFGRAGNNNFLRFGRNNNFMRFGRGQSDPKSDKQSSDALSKAKLNLIMRQIRIGRSVKPEQAVRRKREVSSKSSNHFLRFGRNDGFAQDSFDEPIEVPPQSDDDFVSYIFSERLKENPDFHLVLNELASKMDKDNSKCSRLG